MRLKTVSKFILGITCGSLITVSIYSYAFERKLDSLDTNILQISNDGSGKTTIPFEDINNFVQIYALAKNYYVESVTGNKLIKGAINGLLTNLDPHSNYLDKDDFKQLTEMTNGSFGGLGIEVSRDKDRGGIKVIAPIDGTPAYFAGLKSGDVIIKIDGHPIADLSLEEAVKKMRGKIGTKVTITISRKNELKPLNFTIVRAKIEVHSVKYNILTPGYAYIRITAFQADTVKNLVSALEALNKNNPHLKGLILDLRDDPGGIIQSAVGVAGAFLPKESLIVSTNGRAPNSNQKYYVKPEDYLLGGIDDPLTKEPEIFKTLPMVVLINQGTASASEIVAGALQDYNRAKVVGTKSFGKGSVQTVIPLSETTAIKLTTALYFTPNGHSIQAAGIKPNIIIKSIYDDLYSDWQVSEASLDNHLSNPTMKNKVQVGKDEENTPIIAPPKQISTNMELDAQIKKQLEKRPKIVNQNIAVVDLKDDFQLEWALNILQGKPLPKQNVTKINQSVK